MKRLYNTLITLFLPLAILRLFWRSRKNSDYRKRISERLAINNVEAKGSIWIHCVSVGEFMAMQPLIDQLLANQQALLITTTTPTGSALVREKYSLDVKHQYLPFDIPFLVRRFLHQVRPQLAVFVETEIWPNYLVELKKQSIAALLVNARLSEKSLRGYQRLGNWGLEVIGHFAEIACQNTSSCQRFQQLGGHASVCGNIKFDLSLPENFNQQQTQIRHLLKARPYIIAASTHKDEEIIILNAYQRQAEGRLLIIAPRHPERAQAVKHLANRLGFKTAMFSQLKELKTETNLLIIDVLGKLLPFYSLADYAIIGGSFVARGGHNPLEAALFKTPCVIGKYTFNFQQLIDEMIVKQAILSLDASQLFCCIPAKAIGENAQDFLSQNQGATENYYCLLKRYLKKL